MRDLHLRQEQPSTNLSLETKTHNLTRDAGKAGPSMYLELQAQAQTQAQAQAPVIEIDTVLEQLVERREDAGNTRYHRSDNNGWQPPAVHGGYK